MPILKCTQKLLKVIGIQPTSQPDVPPTLLGDWSANLLSISRQKVLLFTNEATLYSFAVLGVRKAELSSLADLFLQNLRVNLAAEDMPEHVIAKVAAQYRGLRMGRTDNRSVLGSMNELAMLLRQDVVDAGGFGGCDLQAINRQLNRTPHRPLGGKFAADLLHERLVAPFVVPGRQERRVFLN